MSEQPTARCFYRDFETGKRHWTRGQFIGWTQPGGPLAVPYAQLQRRSDVLLIPRSLLTRETLALLPAPESSSQEGDPSHDE